MLETIQGRGQATRILLGAVIGVIALSMLITLLPGAMSSSSASQDVVVEVDGQPITATDVRHQIQQISGGAAVSPEIEHIYAQSFLDQMIMERLIEVEGRRLGIQVTRQEQADRIRAIIPAAASGDMQQYAAEVLARSRMSVPEFEAAVRKMMISEKFAQMVTDGITVDPHEVNEEFRRRNEKITVEYALVKPEDLVSKVSISDGEIAAQYEKNKSSYQMPERRSIRYALLDPAQARSQVTVSEGEVRAYYDENIALYRTENRAQVSHILFKTTGKTDAEIEEIRKKADDVLKQARGKAKFEDLAKQYSDDAKEKGGDIGWITPGQALPEYEKAAFSLAKGSLSEVIKTQLGFYIVKVKDRETARTQPFEEARASILPGLTARKADRAVSDLADKIGSATRQNSRATLDEIAKQFNMAVGEAGPSAVRDPYGALGTSTYLDDAVFRLRQGELSAPIQVPQGYVVLSLTKVEPAHQGTLAEVRGRVETDLRNEKSLTMAKTRAEEIAAQAKSGNLAAVAKAAGITTKTSEAFARTGNITDLGSAKPLAAAFTMNVGAVGPAVSLGANWVVYRVASKPAVDASQIVQQMKEAEQELLRSKQQLAYEAFQNALKARLMGEGIVKFHEENLRRLTARRAS